MILARNESGLYPEFSTSVSGVLFLGTPHQGSSAATYASIFLQIANAFLTGSQVSRLTGPIRTELLRGLEANETELLHIAQDFRTHTSTIRVASFIEQKSMQGLSERVCKAKATEQAALTDQQADRR